jgi:hypothetical protein
MDDIRKRIGLIFNGSYAFENAWKELVQVLKFRFNAHIQHLLQIQPFKDGYFNTLFSLAADLRDAVSRVPDEHLKNFTYSTVIRGDWSKPSQE